MSGMCLRCHFNVPFAPGEDFCIDCAGDVEREIEKLEKQRRVEEYHRLEFSCDPCECGGSPDCPKCNPLPASGKP